ncbi:uncharacterized protein At2g27730, mitochondrial-like [Phragmites australis]|uniref:uncharacterized protein At2g27730, mitochondrial-like n=1 Tax=Phragmites australis TaxID=29695 RepID=UPI002D796B41|nr:uncharacterized protein At2g27730, mitochondrial-like [Phragmites australis]
MATRTAVRRIPQPANWAVVAEAVARRMEGVGGGGGGGLVPRYFSGKTSGRVLGEEESAAENVYIKRMEREKLRRKADKDKAEAAKRDKGDKKGEAHPR